MREMGWSWGELIATPLYVRGCCAAFMSEENEVRRIQYERAEAQQRG